MNAPTRLLALLGSALLCALVANSVASPSRKLSWGGWVPPVETSAGFPPRTTAAPVPVSQAAPAAGPLGVLATPKAPALVRVPARPLSAVKAFRPVPNAPIQEIHTEDAQEAFRQGIAFLDARSSELYRAGHVAGAISLPVWESDLETRLVKFEAQVAPGPETPLVVYCGGGACEDSMLLAQKFIGLGYRNLLVYLDGFPEWAAQGRAVAKGDQ